MQGSFWEDLVKELSQKAEWDRKALGTQEWMGGEDHEEARGRFSRNHKESSRPLQSL